MRKFKKIDEKYLNKRGDLATQYNIDWNMVDSWPLYAGISNIARSISIYEIVKKILHVPGDIAEFGSWRGSNLMWIAKIIKIMDPHGSKQIHCFESFEGLKTFSDEDQYDSDKPDGIYKGNYEMLVDLIDLYEMNDDIRIHKGNIQKTLPDLLNIEPEITFSMLYCDTDLYEPTKLILKKMHSHIMIGGVIVFDEWNDPLWPGETKAANEFIKKYFNHYVVESVGNTRQPTLILKKISN
jgi:hypothetical protein